ncbi:phosphoglycerate kinase [Elstera cyanobacteriorum]|uniref:Phosphoglycerate kinase n=1 Tax=Elstera cyanobacteriorum TaxID=2022747 RepID=A0A255XK77_9PROT|nr:phosphoglycerate kinase [Elstera cyanobacteriorum]OYQ17403.1 phosphoglycerate kinase [Elstera cyanobacteriorum]GFZ93603.1 phosphoglycerate kinase [Elstera cyanobacteriorum]
MAGFRTLDQVEVAGKRVLVRVDLNVPMKDGVVTDATRIDRAAITLAELADKGAKVIVLSHFGRPKNGPDSENSLSRLVAPLSKALGGRPVAFAEDCIGPKADAAVTALAPGGVLLLENLRFHAGEEKNDPAFIAALAQNGDLWVNDAFSAAHRAHASTAGLANKLPAAAGRLMQAELDALTKALGGGDRAKTVAMVGGAKVSTKLDILTNLVTRVGALVIGGAMANTFLYAQGHSVGASLCEKDMADTAKTILEKAAAVGCKIVLPVDLTVSGEFKAGAENSVVAATEVPDGKMALDIGPASVAEARKAFEAASTLVWNGPAGAFEIPPFDAGTVALAQAAAELTQAGKLISVAGGGDTVAALAHAGAVEKFTYISTAGGAFLEWLEGKTLPGVAALAA